MSLPKIKPFVASHKTDLKNLSADLVFVTIDEAQIEKKQIKSEDLKKIDLELDGVISSLIALGDFEGKWLQASTSMLTSQSIAKRVTLIGSGKKTDLQSARARQIGIKAADISSQLKVEKVAFVSFSSLLSSSEQIAQVYLGFGLGFYKYPNSNMSKEKQAEMEKSVSLSFVNQISGCAEALQEAEILQNSTNICRLLQDGPPNIVTPKYVSEHISEEATKLGLNVQVFGAQKLREMGMNAMLAVAGGSANEPQFVVVEYKPQNYNKTIAFVGKGLTMDTGGYSIKSPSTFQEGMKYDMSGSAVVLTSILAIARLKLPVHVYAVGALCENMIDAHAYRVGDVLTSYSGKTIEILNTDAEGRVVLSDALHYAAKDLKPDCIVEYSTLTGAMITTFGHVGAGVFAFDKTLEKTVMEASEKTGERACALPVWEEVADDVKGTISDVCNVSASRGSAGSMSAAAFLKEFVNDVPYAHIDIAGVADGNQSIGYPRKGSSGYGVQLSVEIAKKMSIHS